VIEWELLHPQMTIDHLGYIPLFLCAADPKGASEQFNKHYISGWRHFDGFNLNPETHVLSYPGDPPLYPLARGMLRDETILFYRHAWVVVLQADGTFEVCRMD
jgi:hypothetical protein